MKKQWIITCNLLWVFNLFLYYSPKELTNFNDLLNFLGANLLIAIVCGTIGIILVESLTVFIEKLRG